MREDIFQYQGQAEPPAPSAWEIPGDGAWLAPISQPLPPKPWRPPDDQPAVIDPALIAVVPELSWYRPIDQPIRPAPWRREGLQEIVLEPTLFEAPPELSWYQPIGQPVFPRPDLSWLTEPITILDSTLFAAITTRPRGLASGSMLSGQRVGIRSDGAL